MVDPSHVSKLFGKLIIKSIIVDCNVVRSVAQVAQFYMTIYTAYWGTISPLLVVIFGSIAFCFGAVEIILDHFFPNERRHPGNAERDEEMGNREQER
jgi:hypothetical protein